jgi:hypothetical protein
MKLKKNILILKIISYKKNSNQNNIYQESLKKINLTPINMIVLNKPSERTNSLFNLHFLDLHCKEQNPDYNIMSLDPTSLYIYIYIYKKNMSLELCFALESSPIIINIERFLYTKLKTFLYKTFIQEPSLLYNYCICLCNLW